MFLKDKEVKKYVENLGYNQIAEIPIGETRTVKGLTVKAVKSKGWCNGCIFNGNCGRELDLVINIGSHFGACDEDFRNDKTTVVFIQV